MLILVPLMVNRTIFGTNCSNLCFFHLQQINYQENERIVSCVFNLEQDGPSLESSSYLNVTLGYLGPWDPWTLELLDLFPPPLPPHTSSYLILSLPPTLLLWYCLVWFGMGGLSFSFDIGD